LDLGGFSVQRLFVDSGLPNLCRHRHRLQAFDMAIQLYQPFSVLRKFSSAA
jgi:hypothetical protein